jgi:hypothetical protein
MKQKITLIYESEHLLTLRGLEHTDAFTGHCGTERKLVVELPGDITISQLLEQFDFFMKGVGYVPPNNAHLDYVDNNTDEPKLTP